MRVFLDTNVLISAFISRGICRDILRIIARNHVSVVSGLVLEEFERVLRGKFDASDLDLVEAFELLHQAEVIPGISTEETGGSIQSNDMLILRDAVSANADIVVTGDHGMLVQATDIGIAAVSPRGFLQLTNQTDDAYPLSSEDDQGPIVSEPKAELRENPIKEKSFSFALKIIQLHQELQDQREYVLSKQLLRSGTSIGANIEEATAAESRRDFIHKMKIAMKESRETHYWLRLLDQSDISQNSDLSQLISQCDELSKMLTSITKTAIERTTR